MQGTKFMHILQANRPVQCKPVHSLILSFRKFPRCTATHVAADASHRDYCVCERPGRYCTSGTAAEMCINTRGCLSRHVRIC